MANPEAQSGVHSDDRTQLDDLFNEIVKQLPRLTITDSKDAVSALIGILQAIVNNPRESKFRCLNTARSAFVNRLSSKLGLQNVVKALEGLGFMRADDLIFLEAPEDDAHLDLQIERLRDAIRWLTQHAMHSNPLSPAVAPNDHLIESKTANPATTTTSQSSASNQKVEAQESKTLLEAGDDSNVRNDTSVDETAEGDAVPVLQLSDEAPMVDDGKQVPPVPPPKEEPKRALTAAEIVASIQQRRLAQRTKTAEAARALLGLDKSGHRMAKNALPDQSVPVYAHEGPKAGRVMDMQKRTATLERIQSALEKRRQRFDSKADSQHRRETEGDWTRTKGFVAGSGQTVAPVAPPPRKRTQTPVQAMPNPATNQKRIMTIADLDARDDGSGEDEVGRFRRPSGPREDSWGSMEIPSHYSARLNGGGTSLPLNAPSHAATDHERAIRTFRQLGRQILRLTNEYRASKGLCVLEWDEDAATIAAQHSRAMSLGKVPFDHGGFSERVKAYEKKIGHRAMMSAENLAYATHSISEYPRVVVDGWIKSPGHNRNLLSNTTRCGIGIYQGTDGAIYSTQLFFK